MKKRYVKPQMNVHAIKRLQLLSGSVKGVYGKVEGVDSAPGLKYGGYVDEEDEDTYNPD